MYERKAQELVKLFLEITSNHTSAVKCAKLMIDQIIFDLSEYSGTLDKLRIHEWTKVKSYL